MTKAMSIAVMIALVALISCSKDTGGKDSGGLDAAQESALMAAVAEGNWQEVERICTNWKAKQPKNLVATWLKSWACVGQDKMNQAGILQNELSLFEGRHRKEAVIFAERMVKAYGGSAVAWAFLSNAQVSYGKKKEALKSADRAVSLDERCALAWINKGNALKMMGRYEEAIKCFDKAIQINPNDIMAWVQKGFALEDVNHPWYKEEALKCFDRVIQINPNYALAWITKGGALAMMGRNEEAIKCFDKAIQINPNDTGAWEGKGLVLRQMGRYEEAKECFKKAVELGSPQARQALKRLEREGH